MTTTPCTGCAVQQGTHQPAEALHQIAEPVPSIEAVMHALRASHARTSKGGWGKGDTTHKTVAKRGAGEPYWVAEFRHAADAQFCDLAHAFVPRLIAEVEAQHARIADQEAQLEAIGAGGVEPLRKQAAAQGMEQDAARYQALVESGDFAPSHFDNCMWCLRAGGAPSTKAELDAAVDRVIAAQAKQGGA